MEKLYRVIKEISSGCSLEGLMLKLELQYFGHLLRRVDSLEKTLMPGRFPGGSDGKATVCNAGDLGLIPGLGRSPGEGNGHPLWCSCLESPRDGGAWWASVYGVAQSWTRLSDFHITWNKLIWGLPL